MTQVPFTILTGWLGAGKTTTLNRLLGAPHGRRVAVLVNELGRIAIDTKLILRRGGDILELAGGCLCCKLDVRNDLWDGIGEIVARAQPEHLVLETTGVAEPLAIVEGLARVSPDIRARISLAGIVDVVDAEVGAATLAGRGEAREQLQCADRVLLTKLDRATAAALTATRHALERDNPHAEVASFGSDDAGAMALCHWLLEPRLLSPSAAHALADATPALQRHDHGHRHSSGQLHAMVYNDPAPLVPELLLAVLRDLGDALARAKGFVRLPSGELGFVEKAGAELSLRPRPSLGQDAAPAAALQGTEFVLIGDFDDAAVMRALHACRAAGEPTANR